MLQGIQGALILTLTSHRTVCASVTTAVYGGPAQRRLRPPGVRRDKHFRGLTSSSVGVHLREPVSRCILQIAASVMTIHNTGCRDHRAQQCEV
ncbi:hypothetical protein GDO81_029541 [Engystomops pustulosus]|uniref:Secreted protein n=1 Tax=Engystomops pustulosus TaxID=76066 RepID=A0AAV6YCZ3_ENGPU|nr:hypothetical protein GDO81_029541 [Engystomops pustulosus]